MVTPFPKRIAQKDERVADQLVASAGDSRSTIIGHEPRDRCHARLLPAKSDLEARHSSGEAARGSERASTLSVAGGGAAAWLRSDAPPDQELRLYPPVYQPRVGAPG